MKESNTCAGNVAKNFLRRQILLNIEGQYMKESNTLAGNVENNYLRAKVFTVYILCAHKTKDKNPTDIKLETIKK